MGGPSAYSEGRREQLKVVARTQGPAVLTQGERYAPLDLLRVETPRIVIMTTLAQVETLLMERSCNMLSVADPYKKKSFRSSDRASP